MSAELADVLERSRSRSNALLLEETGRNIGLDRRTSVHGSTEKSTWEGPVSILDV